MTDTEDRERRARRPPPHYKIVPTMDGGARETRRINGWIIDIDAKILWDTQEEAVEACKQHARQVAGDPAVQIEIIQPKWQYRALVETAREDAHCCPHAVGEESDDCSRCDLRRALADLDKDTP